MVKLLVDNEEVKFESTKFPDGTSQVWKIDQYPIFEDENDVKIIWLFENEGELVQVCQLAQLVEKLYGNAPDLVAPYLPYGRQDKEVSNSLSFALHTFTNILYNAANICRVETFDAHSNVQTNTYIESQSPKAFHKAVLNHDVVCFPDKGAARRYLESFQHVPVIYCEKVRNQLTGEITGLSVQTNEHDLNNKRILIVDDICDGGMTFIKVAEALQPYNTLQIDLAVSHGLFSKGRQVLHNAGITNIYTTNSLLRNPEGFKVW